MISSDWIVGDNFLRSVYSVYDFGDFDASGKMGNPYIKLLSLVDPNEASSEFASIRGAVARDNITYNAANSTATTGRTTVSLSDDITDTLHKVSVYFPAVLAIMALNALVILLLGVAAIIYICRRRGGVSSARTRRTKGRAATPMPLEPILSTGSYVDPRSSTAHMYEPVSMALTEDTFVPPTPAFHTYEGSLKPGRQLIDRPKSVA